jgi:hypothetical protein
MTVEPPRPHKGEVNARAKERAEFILADLTNPECRMILLDLIDHAPKHTLDAVLDSLCKHWEGTVDHAVAMVKHNQTEAHGSLHGEDGPIG